MVDEDLVPGTPLVPQLLGSVVGQIVIALIAVPVVLVDHRQAVPLLASLAFMAVFWGAWVGVSRAFFRRPVIRERVRRAVGPVQFDEQKVRARFWCHALVSGAIMIVMSLLMWTLDSLVIVPGLLLGLAGFALLEIRDLRRWQTEEGVVLFVVAGHSRWIRPVGPREPGKLLAVAVPALAMPEDRS